MKIAVVGGYGIGMMMQVPRFPVLGETVSGGLFAVEPGGKGSNQAIAATRLGAEVDLLTAIGRDAAGEDALALWRREGIKTDHVVRADAPTMTGFILVDAEGENQISLAPGALHTLDAHSAELFRDSIRGADMLVVSLEVALDTACAALRIGHQEGTPVLLNPAPAAALPEEVWRSVDVLTPNRSEAALLAGVDEEISVSPDEILMRLRCKTGATIVLTLGSGGCVVMVDDVISHVPPARAERVVDTTGAGDAFTAALAVALVEGRDIAEAVRFASAAGAHAVAHDGVIGALGDRAQIERILATPISASRPAAATKGI